MPRPGKRWRHIIINTHGSWLHGDQRGFRNRGPRIHSAGDYKHRTPKGEHANLLKYMKEKCPKKVKISRARFARRRSRDRAVLPREQDPHPRVFMR